MCGSLGAKSKVKSIQTQPKPDLDEVLTLHGEDLEDVARTLLVAEPEKGTRSRGARGIYAALTSF
jgi:hypothetical protein